MLSQQRAVIFPRLLANNAEVTEAHAVVVAVPAEAVVYRADEAQLRQVFLNLVKNGEDASLNAKAVRRQQFGRAQHTDLTEQLGANLVLAALVGADDGTGAPSSTGRSMV